MTNEWYMTDTDTDAQQAGGWKIAALHVPPVVVSPPSARTNLSSVAQEGPAPLGGFGVIAETRPRPIDPADHEQLLRESLERYGELWRRLAKR